MAKWIAFFSQTGNEIAEVSKQVGRWPDLIITNERPPHLRSINRDVLSHNIITLPNKPSVEDYRRVLSEELYGEDYAIYTKDYVISLHGWLRIMPKEIVREYPVMYNGHPGLINKYPELKGKDPQKKAWDLDLPISGCVIHRVTEKLDGGPIMRSQEISIRNLDMEVIFKKLHDLSIQQWASFLKRHWL
jgi:folate-dependent phosphoribosylglycinamide formyltransferase PurN